jgi:hypothetical protein
VLPAITSFFIAAGLLGAFASMNTYCNGEFWTLIIPLRSQDTLLTAS